MRNATLTMLSAISIVAWSACSEVRTNIDGAGEFGGGKVERLVCTEPLKVNDSNFAESVRFTIEVEIEPGSFFPVSKDKLGTYYQGAPGLVRFRSYQPINGGLYVLNARPDRITAYVGDARVGAKSDVRLARVNLSPDQMRDIHFEYAGVRKSNHAMQPTPGRRTAWISMTPTSHPATTRALASGG